MEPHRKLTRFVSTLAYYTRCYAQTNRDPHRHVLYTPLASNFALSPSLLQVEADIGVLSIPSCSE
ncbi:hypothetical protein WG66_011981 [Moniliophthora roreri]|nr:hypothetical protein WG66_011981 [Moniliophthora roreri]